MLLALELDAASDAPPMNPESDSTTIRGPREEAKPPSSSRRLLQSRRVLAAALMVALITIAIIVKLRFFPSLHEADFALSERNLQHVPSGLVIVRPTRFARYHFNGIVTTSVSVFGKPVPRIMGRNVTLQSLIAAAYGQNVERVAVPADAPKTNFDFLVTARGNQQQKLQEAIRKKLGFVARWEPHDAEVLALKVENADLPGLTVSDAGEKQGVHFNGGKLVFTHLRVGALTGGLEQVLGTPVVDKTGLNDFYNFAVPWSLEAQQQLQNRSAARGFVDKILQDLGFSLKPDTTTVEMLVVKRAK